MIPIAIIENEVAYELEPAMTEEEKQSRPLRPFREQPSPVAVNDMEASRDGVGGVPWERIFFRETRSLPDALEANWSRIALSGLSQKAYSERLEGLAAEPDGWAGPNSKALSAMSLRHFLEFWSEVRDRALEPEFALASNGHLCAEWHSSWKKHLDLEFADDGRVFFGLFDGKSVLEGVEKRAELSRMLLARKNRPLKWMS